MPMSWYAVTFDCAAPSRVADFWASALSRGIADFSTDDHVVLVPPTGSAEPRIVFNRVPEPKTVKNRVHIDISTTDFAVDGARLTHLGATRMADYDFADSRWTTFVDVEGNEFDLVDVTRPSPGAG
jgi:Glyoxalase-like domain